MTSTVRLPSPVDVAIKWTVVDMCRKRGHSKRFRCLEGPMRWEWDLEDRQ